MPPPPPPPVTRSQASSQRSNQPSGSGADATVPGEETSAPTDGARRRAGLARRGTARGRSARDRESNRGKKRQTTATVPTASEPPRTRTRKLARERSGQADLTGMKNTTQGVGDTPGPSTTPPAVQDDHVPETPEDTPSETGREVVDPVEGTPDNTREASAPMQGKNARRNRGTKKKRTADAPGQSSSKDPGVCGAPWCKLPTVINRHPCVICGKPVHDACDAPEQPQNVDAFLEICGKRAAGAKACSDQCWEQELTKYQDGGGPSNDGGRRKEVQASERETDAGDYEGPRGTTVDDVGLRDAVVEVIDISLDKGDEEGGDENELKHIMDALSKESGAILTIPPLDLSLYKSGSFKADLSDIPEPEHAARGIRKHKLSELHERLGELNWIEGCSEFAVAARRTLDSDEQAEVLVAGDKLTIELWLIDGRHRLRAVKILAVSETKWKTLLQNAPVRLWSRKDGKLLTPMEMLQLSRYLNEGASNVIVPDFLDNIHGAISSCFLLRDQTNVAIGDMSRRGLAVAFLKSSTENRKNVQIRHMQRYAMIALRLARSERCREKLFSVYEELRSQTVMFGVTHLAERVLMDQENDEAFCLALDAVKGRVLSKAGGNFERVRSFFYRAVFDLYDEVDRVAKLKEMSTDALLKTTIPFTMDVTRSIEDLVAHAVRSFSLNNTSTDAADLRMKTLRGRLRKALGSDDIDPIEEQNVVPEDESVDESWNPFENGTGSGDNSPEARRTGRRNRAIDYTETGQGIGSRKKPKKRKQTKKRKTRSGDGGGGGDRSRKKQRISELQTLAEQIMGFDIKSIVSILSRVEGLEVYEKAIDESVEDMEEETPSSGSTRFDDIVPADLPLGYEDPEPYTGPQDPSWCKMVRRLPSQWPKNNPIQHAAPFLKMMYIPHEHRANVTIQDLEDLRTNHHLVYWRAAYNYYRRNPDDIELGTAQFPTEDEKFWAAAVYDDTAALSYFGECRGKLQQKGFCILDGFLDDARVPDQVGDKTIPKLEGGVFFTRLRQDALESFPEPKTLQDHSKHTDWTWILNRGVSIDSRSGSRGIARYITKNRGITTAIEQNEDRVWACASRALLDARVGQSIAALRAWDNRGNRERMFVPKTGGRWLLTSKECKRQLLHTDFDNLSPQDVDNNSKCPGYFVICTGDREVPLWICVGSHRSVSLTKPQDIAALGRASVATLQRIPPFSIFVGRGDVFHAGSGDNDFPGQDGRIRYHMYLVPEKYELPDGIHLMSSFNPRFKADPTADTDDEMEENGAVGESRENEDDPLGRSGDTPDEDDVDDDDDDDGDDTE